MSGIDGSPLDRLSPFDKAPGLGVESAEGALSRAERHGISRRLGINLLGAGVLSVGLLIEHASADQLEVAQLVQAASALIVSLGVLGKAVRGFLARPARDYTEQLVALAVLAAMAAGDFVSAALIPLFLEIGHAFEERSALGAQAAVQRLRELCARNATILVDGKESSVSPADIEPGSTLIVRPGEVVAADGTVRNGYASIDQSPVTGESEPADAGPGDRVFAGAINLNGVLQVTVEDSGNDTVLGEVIRVLQEVERTKTPTVRMLERAASVYLPVVVSLAAAVLFVTGELSRFVTVLIVACPCALVLAAPAAMVAALSLATRSAVMIKKASFLETAARTDTLILDKTGTLTEGTQTVDAIDGMNGCTDDEVLRLAAAVANGSRHPASRAVVEAASARGIPLHDVSRCQERAGRGVEAELAGDVIRIGRASWLSDCGVAAPPDTTRAGIWVSKNTTVIGFVSLLDRPRRDAEITIKAMRELGFSRILLLTGDKRAHAERIARQLDLDDVVAEVLPTEKLDVVRREQHSGRAVLMVGDGVNDALALSAADIGVAVGADMNDVALGGADVAVLSDDLTRLPFTIRLADRARQTIVENVLIGLTFSLGMLSLASFGWISPLAGALLHNAGAVLVVINSSRLLKPDSEEKAAPNTYGNRQEEGAT